MGGLRAAIRGVPVATAKIGARRASHAYGEFFDVEGLRNAIVEGEQAGVENNLLSEAARVLAHEEEKLQERGSLKDGLDAKLRSQVAAVAQQTNSRKSTDTTTACDSEPSSPAAAVLGEVAC